MMESITTVLLKPLRAFAAYFGVPIAAATEQT
jgi:hypothetical protein